MRIVTSFDPIEVGELDNFAFDFTADVGDAAIASTAWVCALAPYQTAVDPAPQSRIISVSTQSAIRVRSPVNGSLQIREGSFSVALVGGMPSSAAGATYILEATVNLSDGRVLKLNATLECKSPGA
ncbi:MAG: hypothetical protein ACJ8AH_09515 [Stellaceae bacterium]|jgi:hypothetical protein